MTNKADEHQRLILEQFTKQAIPFSQMQNHSPELLLAASRVGPVDTVLDVACGTGVVTRIAAERVPESGNDRRRALAPCSEPCSDRVARA